MIAILVCVLLVLCGTHYIAYTLGQESGDAKWSMRVRKLQDYYTEKESRKLKAK